MEIVLDACTIINLINGGVLGDVLSLPGHVFFVGDMVLEQEMLDPAQKETLLAEISNNTVILLESNVTVSQFNQLRELHNLGMGETECLALCKNHNYCIATDDKKARKCSISDLGEDHVVGSLYLLKECVSCDIIPCEEATLKLILMRAKGGFLPTLDEKYFCPKIAE